jgi:hypothetical protein
LENGVCEVGNINSWLSQNAPETKVLEIADELTSSMREREGVSPEEPLKDQTTDITCGTWKDTIDTDINESHIRDRADFLRARPE